MEDSEERSAACPLEQFSKEDLIRLIRDYSKTWLALDGVWFQSVEQADGIEAAMFHDARAWERFTVIEAKRIKSFLRLGERPGASAKFAAEPSDDWKQLFETTCLWRAG